MASTPIPGDTYAERAIAGTLSGRFDSTGMSSAPSLNFTTAATPVVQPGTLVFNTATPSLGVRYQWYQHSTPVWRTISAT